MSIEQWHETIRKQDGTVNEDSFWTTPIQSIEGDSDFRACLISVKDNNNRGLTEGVYAYTNLTLEELCWRPHFLTLLEEHIFQLLERVPIKVTPSHLSPNGAVVFKIEARDSINPDPLVIGFTFSKS